ncbi:MAG: nuclear transport factor 2 family protein [Myxococcota bacterium]|nr:nuclear transport factor 2 family protein [Myxococcales bacterium]
MSHNKDVVRTFFRTLWSDPETARALATDDVTWITTRSMPIPGNEGTIRHVGFEAVRNVADSGKKIDSGYRPETMSHPHELFLEAEDDHVVYQFTMRCTTKLGRDYVNDYLFLVKLEGGKIARFQEYWDSKQAYDVLVRGRDAATRA